MLRLYKDTNFQGGTFEAQSSIKDLHDAGFGDRATSLEVVPSRYMGPDGEYIIHEIDPSDGKIFEAWFAFQHTKYGGDVYGPFIFGCGYLASGDFGFKNDEISSLLRVRKKTDLVFMIQQYGRRMKSENHLYSKSTQEDYKSIGSFYDNLRGGNFVGCLKSMGYRTGVVFTDSGKTILDLGTDAADAGKQLADIAGENIKAVAGILDTFFDNLFDTIGWWQKYKWWVIGFLSLIGVSIVALLIWFIFFRKSDPDTIYIQQQERQSQVTAQTVPSVAGAVTEGAVPG